MDEVRTAEQFGGRTPVSLDRNRSCALPASGSGSPTYNDLSGTPLAHLRLREKWLDYLNTMLDSKSVRKAAREVGVHRNTAFRWRHRFLDQARHDRPKTLSGIAEADEMFILESQKGSRKLDRPARKRGGRAHKRGISGELDCILVARDRSGLTIDAVVGRGSLKSRAAGAPSAAQARPAGAAGERFPRRLPRIRPQASHCA